MLRTPRVWVDRSTFYVAYMAFDEDGASTLAPTPSVSINANLPNWAQVGCTTHGLSAPPHIAYCSVTVDASAFGSSEGLISSDSQTTVQLKVDGFDAVFASPQTVTLTRPPNWCAVPAIPPTRCVHTRPAL